MLRRVPRVNNDNVLVGFETSDDAGVFKLTDDCALVQTVDFFTPIVDDPAIYGAIAAANSLSDIYAMGGRPISALALVCYPGKGEIDDLAEILAGGARKMHEAGCVVLGGHSVADDEIKFGYSVTGTVHPGKIRPNGGARPGDSLILTKPLGTGVIATALKRGIAEEEHVRASVESMLTLNKLACETMLEFDAHGVTDVTGFGLIGHAREMAVASGVTLEIDSSSVRFLPGAIQYAQRGALSGGLKNNREFASEDVEGSSAVDDLLYDPQTSGGLLISLPENDAAQLVDRLPGSFRIGRVTPKSGACIRIV